MYVLDAENLGRLKEINPNYVPKKEKALAKEMDDLTKTFANTTMVPIDQEVAKTPKPTEKVEENQLDLAKESKFQCPKEMYGLACTYIAKSQKGLNVHISMKHKSLDGNLNDESFKCKACNKPFSNASGLTRHELACDKRTSPEKNQQFQCSKCQKSFMYVKNLQRHLKTSKTCGNEIN